MLITVPKIGIASIIGTVYKADGSVPLSSASIQREGNVYTFTGNVTVDGEATVGIMIDRDNVVVEGNGFTLSSKGVRMGIYLFAFDPSRGISNITIRNLRIDGFDYGIRLFYASNNTISGCVITNSNKGIWISHSSDENTISHNYIANNFEGIDIDYSSNNIFKNNSLVDNENPLTVTRDWVHYFDSTNTINGKPIYYFVNKSDSIFSPSDFLEIGYLAFVNCKNITVQKLNLTNNKQGIILAFTTNSTIRNNSITNNSNGIFLYGTSNINVTNNYITNNGNGIKLLGSNIFIFRNNIVSNNMGIYVSSELPNKIVANNIVNNTVGIYFDWCDDQNIYHNNFINNTSQVAGSFWNPSLPVRAGPQEIHIWDNGFEGNYWSSYNGTDIDGDGIGDIPYILNGDNQDNYPLMNHVDITTVPEFPSWIILPLFLMTALFAVVLKKRICYRSAT